MPRTSRVDYLLRHFGELSDAELQEARAIAMGRPTDYLPIIPGTDAEPIRDPDYVDEMRRGGVNRGWEGHQQSLPLGEPKTPRSLEYGNDSGTTMAKDAGPAPVRPGSRLEGLAAVEERLSMLEATAKDLYAKLKALESRLGVGKDTA